MHLLDSQGTQSTIQILPILTPQPIFLTPTPQDGSSTPQMSQACSYSGPLHILPRHKEPSSHTHISPAVLILQSSIHKSRQLQTRQTRPCSIILSHISASFSFIAFFMAFGHISLVSICLISFFPGTTLSTMRAGTSLFCHPPNLQALALCQTRSKCLINIRQMTKWVIPYPFLLSLLPSPGDLKVGSHTRPATSAGNLLDIHILRAQTRGMKSQAWGCSVFTGWFWCVFKCEESSCSKSFCATEMTSLPFDLLLILQVLAQMFTLPGSLLSSSPKRTIHHLQLQTHSVCARHLQCVPLLVIFTS